MTRCLICIGAAVLSVILFAAGVAAQSSITVAGTIKDSDGAVLLNAEVQLLNIGSGRPLTTRTDAAGKYELTGLPTGAYRLTVSSDGFALAARSLVLRHR